MKIRIANKIIHKSFDLGRRYRKTTLAQAEQRQTKANDAWIKLLTRAIGPATGIQDMVKEGHSAAMFKQLMETDESLWHGDPEAMQKLKSRFFKQS